MTQLLPGYASRVLEMSAPSKQIKALAGLLRNTARRDCYPLIYHESVGVGPTQGNPSGAFTWQRR